jgi:hypothetical protein
MGERREKEFIEPFAMIFRLDYELVSFGHCSHDSIGRGARREWDDAAEKLKGSCLPGNLPQVCAD